MDPFPKMSQYSLKANRQNTLLFARECKQSVWVQLQLLSAYQENVIFAFVAFIWNGQNIKNLF